MTKSDLSSYLDVWESALGTFDEILLEEENAIVRDAAIKRFEYNFELAWKAIKRFAALEGESCDSPRSAFRTALRLSWIDDDEIWLDMLDDRNRTTHTYKEATAESVYHRLESYLKVMKQLKSTLESLEAG